MKQLSKQDPPVNGTEVRYISPEIKVVSFMIEGGFGYSEKQGTSDRLVNLVQSSHDGQDAAHSDEQYGTYSGTWF